MFNTVGKGIDFEKMLWDKHRIRYGKKWVDYEPWPRQWRTRGILNNEKVVPLTFSLTIKPDEAWVQIEKGGVTGYESAKFESLWSHHRDWCACAGGMGWSRLDIRWKDLAPMLREMKDYLSTIRRNDG